MATREEDIDWDCYIDPPYVELTDEEIREIEAEINLDFIEMEDEEIQDLIKKEPKL